MNKISIPYDCLSCSYRPGEADFVSVDCITCSQHIIELYKSFIKDLESLSDDK